MATKSACRHRRRSLPSGGDSSRRRAGDLTAWSAAEAAYDLALIAYLHLPWQQIEHVFEQTARAVRPAGTLLLVGHAAAHLRQGHGAPQDPRALSTAEQVAAAWRPCAALVRAETVHAWWTIPDGPRTALDTLVRAVRL